MENLVPIYQPAEALDKAQPDPQIVKSCDSKVPQQRQSLSSHFQKMKRRYFGILFFNFRDVWFLYSFKSDVKGRILEIFVISFKIGNRSFKNKEILVK